MGINKKSTVIAAGLVALSAMLSGCGSFQVGGTSEDYVIAEESYSVGEVRSILLKSDITDVYIEESMDDEIHLKVTGNKTAKDKLKVDTKTSGDGLNVQLKHKSGFNWFAITKSKLTLELPAAEYEKIEIGTATGDVTSSAIAARALKIQSSTGDLSLDGYEGGSLYAKTDTGDMVIDEVTAAGTELKSSTGDISVRYTELGSNVGIETDTGDIQLEIADGQLAGDVDIDSDTGDVLVKLPRGQSNVTVDLNSSTGDAIANFEGMDYEHKAEHRVEGRLGDGGHKVKVVTATGDISVVE
ncbi:DUF4097 family beta strand repeat-containing protein [Paenibacillus thermotolerans]|uniref:DUF4097 family beta strand repeat-containing protein n=1 Tax=Paenibacillus thermotolerans TaxID=3027807 RepID=UPI002368E984|nr:MULTISPECIES: DUF4097 family beta strand repeat-containing protein [unclassified Paenibacillus]